MNRFKWNLSGITPDHPEFKRFLTWASPALSGAYPYNFSAEDAVFAYKITGNAAWEKVAVTIIEKNVAKAEAEIALGQKPADITFDSYLYAGPFIKDLALTYDTCPSVTPEQKKRWGIIADQTIFNIWNNNQATWGGKPFPHTGWANNNPGDNYYYAHLTGTVYWALCREADGDMTVLNLCLAKGADAVAYYQIYYPEGGGSLEGTGYGTAQVGFFRVLRVLADHMPDDDGSGYLQHIQDTAEYWIHATTPNLKFFAPIGDLSRVSFPYLYDYHRDLVTTAGNLSPEPQRQMAAWWLNHITPNRMNDGFNLRKGLAPISSTELAPTKLYHYSKSAGHLFARSSWDKRATWISFIAGRYIQNHAHQDQGSFNLFRDVFLTVDQGVYSKSGCEQATDVHNMMRFEKNGQIIPQYQTIYVNGTLNGAEMGVYDEDGLNLLAELNPFYKKDSGVKSWVRELDFNNQTLRVFDTLSLNAGVTGIFQLQTPVKPVIENGTIKAGALTVKIIEPANPTIKISDWKELFPEQYKDTGGWRIDIGGSNTKYHVLLETSPTDVADSPAPSPTPTPSSSTSGPTGINPITGNVWIDGALPRGARAGVEGLAWKWEGRYHISPVEPTPNQHFFYDAADTLPLVAGDILEFEAEYDVKGKTLMIQCYDEKGSWDHRAYWGDTTSKYGGTDGTASRMPMGPLPEPGKHIFSMPVEKLNLVGRTLRGLSFAVVSNPNSIVKFGKFGKIPIIVEPEEDPVRIAELEALVKERDLTIAGMKVTEAQLNEKITDGEALLDQADGRIKDLLSECAEKDQQIALRVTEVAHTRSLLEFTEARLSGVKEKIRTYRDSERALDEAVE